MRLGIRGLNTTTALKSALIALSFAPALALSATYTVSTADQLRSKLASAASGDVIILKAGTYKPGTALNQNTLSAANGGANRTIAAQFKLVNKSNITIKAESATNKPIISGTSKTDGKYAFYAQKANGLRIENIKFTNVEKGVVIDRSDNIKFYNNEIYMTGAEGLHLRDGSDGAHIKGNKIKQIGFNRKDRGEGLYICNDMKKWHSAYTSSSDDIYQKNCDNTKVEANTFGPDIGAEHIDIKEGVTGTRIWNNTFVAKLTNTSLMNASGDYPMAVVYDKGADSRIYSNSFNMASAKFDPTASKKGAIAVMQVIDSPKTYWNVFGHDSGVVKNTVTNAGTDVWAVYLVSRGSATLGCNTRNGSSTNTVQSWGSKATVSTVSGTGCNAYDPN